MGGVSQNISGVVWKMKIELVSSLTELTSVHPDMGIAGLDGNEYASVQLTEFTDKNAFAAVRSVLEFLLPLDNMRGWICTMPTPSADRMRYRKAGWLPNVEEMPMDPKLSLLLWKAIVDPNSEQWEPFWDVPLQSLFTNVVLTQGALQRAPPDHAMCIIEDQLSTLLRWPWLENLDDQNTWLSHSHISLLILGFLECESGIQFVLRKPYVSPIMTILSNCSEGQVG